MNRATLLLVGVVSILGVAACSSDSKLSVTSSKQHSSGAADDSASASTDSSDSGADTGTGAGSALSVPDIGSIPGISEECSAYLTAIASAFTPNAGGGAQLAESFDALEKQVPDDLKDDVRVLAAGFEKLQRLYAKYDNDYSKIATDPEAAALFSDQAFADASTNVSAWLESECPSG